MNFFTCVSYAEARNIYRLDVRPSVCPSVCLYTLVLYQNCFIVMLSSPHDSSFILVLCTVYQDLREIPTETE